MAENQEETKGASQQQWDKNVLLISTRRRNRFYMWQAKVKLREMDSIELHGLGDAMSLVVSVAESLQRLDYVKITKIQTLTTDVKTRDNFTAKRAKLIITIQKTSNFDTLYDTYEKNRSSANLISPEESKQKA